MSGTHQLASMPATEKGNHVSSTYRRKQRVVRRGEVVGASGVGLQEEDGAEEHDEDEERQEVAVMAHLLLHGHQAVKHLCREMRIDSE